MGVQNGVALLKQTLSVPTPPLCKTPNSKLWIANINRPSVAAAVLQTPLELTDSFIYSLSNSFVQNLQDTVHIKP